MSTSVRVLALSMIFCCSTVHRATHTLAEPIDQIVQARLESVVRIQGRSADGSTSWGSGVFIGDRYVVTAKHVLRGCNAAECQFFDGAVHRVVQAFDSAIADQAVLELATTPRATPARIAAVDPERGSRVTLAGFDNGHRLRFFDTSIGISGQYDRGTVSDAYAPAISGNSGGGVFDTAGRLVGTLWGSDGRTTSLVNVNATHRFMRELATRYPAFGSCYGQACVPAPRPVQPIAPVTPLEPVIRQPTPQPEASKTCDCGEHIDRLIAALTQTREPQVLTDERLRQAIVDYLQSDPLTVTMILRNPDGSVDDGAVDVARVIPRSQLTDEQRALIRESLQLTPKRKP